MFGEVAAYVHAVPCYYLHSTVTRLKITDCPNAFCPFYHRTGHVSPPQALIQLDEAISLTPYSVPMDPRPGIRPCKVHMYASPKSIIIKTVMLALVLWTFCVDDGAYITPSMLATCDRLYLLFSLIPLDLAPSSLRYTDCFDTQFFF